MFDFLLKQKCPVLHRQLYRYWFVTCKRVCLHLLLTRWYCCRFRKSWPLKTQVVVFQLQGRWSGTQETRWTQCRDSRPGRWWSWKEKPAQKPGCQLQICRSRTHTSFISLLKAETHLSRTLPSHLTVTERSSLSFRRCKQAMAFKLAAAAQHRLVLLGPALYAYKHGLISSSGINEAIMPNCKSWHNKKLHLITDTALLYNLEGRSAVTRVPHSTSACTNKDLGRALV